MAEQVKLSRLQFWWLTLAGAIVLSVSGLCCAVVVLGWFRASFEPRVITDRSEWPPELAELITESHLSTADIGTIEVIHLGMGDGWFCRMRQTPGTTALVTSRWIPIEKSPAGESAQQRFFNWLPQRWSKPTPAGRFYIHPDYSTQEEGNGTAFIGLIDEEGKDVFVWYYFNF